MKRFLTPLLLATTFSVAAQEIIPISPNGVWTMQGGSGIIDEFVAFPPFGIGIESIVDVNDTAYFQFSHLTFVTEPQIIRLIF